MRLTGRPEAAHDPGSQVERLREAVDILLRVTSITDRAFREAVVEGYIVLPPPLRDRVTTTVAPAVHADYLARIEELSAEARRLREWAERLPQAGVTVSEPRALDPARLLAGMRRPVAGAAPAAVSVPAAASAPATAPIRVAPPVPPTVPWPPVAAPAAAAGPTPGIAETLGVRIRRRPLVAAAALLATAAAVGAGVALLRPAAPAAPARDLGATTVTVVAPGLPAAREGEAIAAGPGSQAAVLFGGAARGGGALLADTWVFDGHAWSELHPGSTPVARTGALAAYDSTRHQLVLTGGRGAAGPLTDTWTWDGVGWTSQLPETPPRLGTWSAMAGDAAARSVVLVSGRAGAPAQTWLWDGRNWSLARPPVEPPLSGPPVMSADPLTGHVILVTAAGPGASPVATWSWDGRTWSLQPSGPAALVRPGSAWMAADLTAHRVLLFETGTAGGATWLWDGSRWSFVFSAVAPTVGADGVASGLVTDPVAGRPRLVGAGASGDPARFRRGWLWHGDGWRPG